MCYCYPCEKKCATFIFSDDDDQSCVCVCVCVCIHIYDVISVFPTDWCEFQMFDYIIFYLV